MPKKRWIRTRYTGVRQAAWREGCFEISYANEDGIRKQETFYARTAYEASRERENKKEYYEKVRKGIIQPKQLQISMGELWTQYFESRTLDVANGSITSGTLDRIVNSYDALLNYMPEVEDKMIFNLAENDIKRWLKKRKEDGIKLDTRINDLVRIRGIINWGVKRDLVTKNPLNNIPRPKAETDKEANQEVRYLEEDELEFFWSILDIARQQSKSLANKQEAEMYLDARDLAIMYIFTGARATEILLPRFPWKNVDLKGGVITLFGKRHKLRSIVIADMPEVIEILNRRRRNRKKYQDGPFHTLGVDVASYRQAYFRITHLLSLAGLENANIHTLRKTAGAYYLMESKDLVATANFLGHSDPRVTRVHYVGIASRIERNYNKEFARRLSGYHKNEYNGKD